MLSIKRTFQLLLILLAGVSCSQHDDYVGAENEIVYTRHDSPYQITSDIIVEKSMKLVILPGAELVFNDTAQITIKGSIDVRGTLEKPVILRPADKAGLWGGIVILQPDDSCSIVGMHVRNGLIYGEDANVRMQHCKMYNTYNLEKFDALIRLFRGSVHIQGSRFESNHTGEGILIHKTKQNKTLVENCKFYGVSDAVEYLNVFNGIIQDNRFYEIQQELGDAIDLNGCRNIYIANNRFERIRDFGIETGNDKYGPSKDIFIYKNIFVDCYKGVVVKGGSNAVVLNNTFYENDFGVCCMVEHYGSNFDPNQIEVINSIFSSTTNNDFLNNDNSTISFRNSLSDRVLFNGSGNIHDDPAFASAQNGDFRLTEVSPCIGAAFPYEKTDLNMECLDLGALCYEKIKD